MEVVTIKYTCTRILALIALIPSGVLAMPFDKADAWRSDLDMLSDTLQERHIDLYHRVSEEEFVRGRWYSLR